MPVFNAVLPEDLQPHLYAHRPAFAEFFDDIICCTLQLCVEEHFNEIVPQCLGTVYCRLLNIWTSLHPRDSLPP